MSPKDQAALIEWLKQHPAPFAKQVLAALGIVTGILLVAGLVTAYAMGLLTSTPELVTLKPTAPAWASFALIPFVSEAVARNVLHFFQAQSKRVLKALRHVQQSA